MKPPFFVNLYCEWTLKMILKKLHFIWNQKNSLSLDTLRISLSTTSKLHLSLNVWTPCRLITLINTWPFLSIYGVIAVYIKKIHCATSFHERPLSRSKPVACPRQTKGRKRHIPDYEGTGHCSRTWFFLQLSPKHFFQSLQTSERYYN